MTGRKTGIPCTSGKGGVRPIRVPSSKSLSLRGGGIRGGRSIIPVVARQTSVTTRGGHWPAMDIGTGTIHLRDTLVPGTSETGILIDRTDLVSRNRFSFLRPCYRNPALVSRGPRTGRGEGRRSRGKALLPTQLNPQAESHVRVP